MKTALLLIFSLTTSPLLAAPLKRTTESSAASTDALTNALPGVVPVKREAEPQDLNSLLAPVTGLAGGSLKEREAEPQDLSSLLAPVTSLAGGGLAKRDAKPQDLNSLLAPVTGLAGGGLNSRQIVSLALSLLTQAECQSPNEPN